MNSGPDPVSVPRLLVRSLPKHRRVEAMVRKTGSLVQPFVSSRLALLRGIWRPGPREASADWSARRRRANRWSVVSDRRRARCSANVGAYGVAPARWVTTFVAVAILYTAAFLGCSPRGPGPAAPRRAVRVPPAGRTGPLERPRSFPGFPELERFADAGAWIIPEMTGTGWCQPSSGATSITFEDQPVGKDMLRGLEQIKRLVFLGFDSVRFRPHALSPLNGARTLYGLRIHGCEGLDDELMMDIVSAPELRELWVSESKVTGRGLRLLRSAKELCDIDFSGSDVGDDVLAVASGNIHVRNVPAPAKVPYVGVRIPHACHGARKADLTSGGVRC